MNENEKRELVKKSIGYAKRNKILVEKLVSDGTIPDECMICGDTEHQLFAWSLNGVFQGLYCNKCLLDRYISMVNKK